MNTVDYLLQNGFSSHSNEMKLEIKRLGRHIPEHFEISQRGKSQNRSFNYHWFQDKSWLTGSDLKKKLYCFPCLLFGDEGVWTKAGFSDMAHLSERMKKHEKSKNHLTACLRLNLYGRVDIRRQLDDGYRTAVRRHNQLVDNNRHVLSKLIDVIKFCGGFELALRGHDESESSENPGIFRGLVDLMAELDNVLSDHLKNATVFKGTSKTIQNGLLDCMFQVYLKQIHDEINKANFVSIQADETTDVSCRCQLVIILRYLCDGKIRERFLGFHEAKVKTAEAISDILLREIESYNLQQKLISQTYDGASTMSGRRGGVQTKMRAHYPYAHFVHCYAHQLNLIMEQACTTQVRPIKIFFANLSAFPTFFSGSPKRTAALKQTVHRRLPRGAATRWNFNSRTVGSIYENRVLLLDCLKKIRDGGDFGTDENGLQIKFEWDRKTIAEASGLVRWLEDEEFLSFLNFFHKVLPHVDILYGILQRREITVDTVTEALTRFEENINKVRGEVDNLCRAFNDNDLGEAGPPRKRTCRQPEEISASCKESCDIMISQAHDRFSSVGQLIPLQLVDPHLFAKYKRTFPADKLDEVTEYFPMVAVEKLKTELDVLYSRTEFHEAKSSLQLMECLQENNLIEAFSETFQLLEINATTPLTSTESERCFSTLKRIKTFLRNTMTNERLNALAMLSIHKDLIRSIPDFNDKVIDLFAQLKTRRADFLYKTLNGQ